jgi:hypothetical protein
MSLTTIQLAREFGAIKESVECHCGAFSRWARIRKTRR